MPRSSINCAHLHELVRLLVYSAHDELHNDAVVLRDLVLGRKTA